MEASQPSGGYLPQPPPNPDKDAQMQSKADKLFETGLMLLNNRKALDKAIKCIQKAITIDDLNYKYWSALGEAFYRRESLNPAINCFIRSVELAEKNIDNNHDDASEKQADCIQSRLRMSDIRLSVNQLDEAAIGYRDILAKNPKIVDALIGLSKTELQMSKNAFFSGLVKSGHCHCMQALHLVLKAIKINPVKSLSWKLASDCCLNLFINGQRGSYEAKIVPDLSDTIDGELKITRQTCIELAQRFLCRSLSLENPKKSGYLWHNLGICLYLKSQFLSHEDKNRVDLLVKSVKCFLKAYEHDRLNSDICNSLGVVAFNLDYHNTAQNFLIKSIHSNLSTSEMQFSNLGYMYLQLGEFQKASACFDRCQAEEPLYCRSWLGNAIINEHQNIGNLSYLRHCHRLGNNYESQLMFSSKVCSLPSIDPYKKDVIDALDCMTRIINYDVKSLAAINTLGLLYEKQGYIAQARQCLDMANKEYPQDSRVIFNRLRLHDASNSCLNDGLLFTNSNSNIEKVISSGEKLAESGKRDYLLNYISYLFANQDFQTVSSKLRTLLEKLPSEDLRTKICAQIMMGLSCRKDDDFYQSWFYKSAFDLEDAHIEGLINSVTLMIVGTVDDDKQLMDHAQENLYNNLMAYISHKPIQFDKLYQSNEGYWIRMALLGSIYCFEKQTKIIRPILAMFPMVAELWLLMGLSLMFQSKSEQQSAIFCINQARSMSSTNPDLIVFCDMLLSIMSLKIKIRQEQDADRIKHLSRAVAHYPNYFQLWTILMDLSNSVLGNSNKGRIKPQINDEDNTKLFLLAMDHFLTKVLIK